MRIGRFGLISSLQCDRNGVLQLWAIACDRPPSPGLVHGWFQALPSADVLLHPRLPYTEAEVRWAVRYELARTVKDVLARRTRSLLLDAIASLESACRVAAILAEEFGQDESWQQQQIEAYTRLVQNVPHALFKRGV